MLLRRTFLVHDSGPQHLISAHWAWMPEQAGDEVGTLEAVYFDTALDEPVFATVTWPR